ncbi:hypothetical protein ACWGJX_47585 [Streptomyces sp. NPDC054775]
MNRLLAVRWLAALTGRALPEAAAAPSVSAPDRHNPQTAERLRGLLEHCPELLRTHPLIRQFAAMLDSHHASPLPEWLDRLTNSGLAPFAASAVREDQKAIAQGITTPYKTPEPTKAASPMSNSRSPSWVARPASPHSSATESY